VRDVTSCNLLYSASQESTPLNRLPSFLSFPACKVFALTASVVPRSMMRPLGFGLLLLLFMVTGSDRVCGGQTPPTTKPSNSAASKPAAPIEVVIFVQASRPDSARVTVIYQKKVPHAQVKKEIERLAVNGWQVANDLKIEDRSIEPSDLKSHPIETGAAFTLLSAPQVQDNGPVLWNYLQAFQSWSHLEVMFQLSGFSPYNGVEKFDSPALSVQRIPNDSLYDYEVVLRDHSHPLPMLPKGASPSGAAAPEGSVGAVQSKPAPYPLLPVMLFIVGSGLLGGAGLYLVLARRHLFDR
jgi:hypothetical protein